MNTRFYETFIVLAKLGNFSQTAKQMNATQPAINGRISALEEQFGFKLYEKGAKPFKLTAEGKIVLEYAKAIVQMEDDLKARLSKNKASGLVRIGAIEIATMSFLPEFIRDLQAQCQGIVLDITTGTVAELMPALKNDELDLVFVVGIQPEYGIHSEEICSFAMWWFASPKYFDTSTVLDASDLSKFRIVMASPKTSISPYLREYVRLHGMEDVFFDTNALKFDNVASVPTAMSMVKGGFGILPAPAVLVLQQVRNDEVVRLPVRQELPNIHMSVCFKEGANLPLTDQIITIARQSAARYAADAPDGLVWT